jgi:two-component system chemotaxis response regulator CheY
MQALVIDDSRAMRKILGRILSDLGFDIREAANGSEALDHLSEDDSPRLALVDWNMPVMNGYEFVKAVRAEDRYDGLRLMMVTTETGAQEMSKALDAGANEYVMKPFTKEVIVEKLKLMGL